MVIGVLLLSLGCFMLIYNSLLLALLRMGEPLDKTDGSLITGIVFGVLFAIAGVACIVCGIVKLIRTIKGNKSAVQRAQEEGVELKSVNLCRELDGKDYLQLDKGEKAFNKFMRFLIGIPKAIWRGIKKIGLFFKKLGLSIVSEAKDIWTTFVNGDWKTKISFLVMGFGNIARGQILRGVLFLLFEIVFILYMIFIGGYYLSKLPTLGSEHAKAVETHIGRSTVTTIDPNFPGDNSFQILLYGVLTLFFIIAFIYTWRVNIRQNKMAEEILKTGKKLKSGKSDLHSLVDDQFHKTLLALPTMGILIFTVMPIVFMILVAFTSYDSLHIGMDGMPWINNMNKANAEEFSGMFHWVGFENFSTLLTWQGGGGTNYAATFGEILLWTLVWAFFATFTNYFLGILVAMAINKKGIQLKKVWRTILIMTIAIPQFISLLYVARMFSPNGLVNGFLHDLGILKQGIDIDWLQSQNTDNPTMARIMVIIINIWIGIPYLMLIATGILMNIPADLYESAKIDGASGWKQFSKITMPYMLFITGPYLLTSFTGNMNNFNVIYLLTGGNPKFSNGGMGSPGKTDLLITWLFKMTQSGQGGETSAAKYNMASVIGILVFIVVSVISLIVYGLLPSVKNEEDYQ